MLCHNKPLFRPRSEGLGHLAHSVYTFHLTKSGPLCKRCGHHCLKICLRSKAALKLNFRELYEEMYTASWSGQKDVMLLR